MAYLSNFTILTGCFKIQVSLTAAKIEKCKLKEESGPMEPKGHPVDFYLVVYFFSPLAYANLIVNKESLTRVYHTSTCSDLGMPTVALHWSVYPTQPPAFLDLMALTDAHFLNTVPPPPAWPLPASLLKITCLITCTCIVIKIYKQMNNFL